VPYQISISREAAKTFRKLHPEAARWLKTAILALVDDLRPPGCIQLVGGEGELCIRVGEDRVVYEIIDNELVVLVLRVAHRREAYR
jgi:mRNA interferase RelE/StbE